MAQQQTKIEAVLQESKDRIHFLRSTDEDGFQNTSARLGFYQLEHSVLVFSRSIDTLTHDRPADVTFCLKTGGFGVQESINPEEARALARALNMAADIADIENNLANAKNLQVAA